MKLKLEQTGNCCKPPTNFTMYSKRAETGAETGIEVTETELDHISSETFIATLHKTETELAETELDQSSLKTSTKIAGSFWTCMKLKLR